MRYLWLYFHPAKFDDFKDEKMSDYKTVSVAQSKNLLGWKYDSLTNYELLLRAVFYVFGAILSLLFFKYCSGRTNKSHKQWWKKTFSKFNYEFQSPKDSKRPWWNLVEIQQMLSTFEFWLELNTRYKGKTLLGLVNKLLKTK